MKYKNNTSEGIVIPFRKPQVDNEIADTGWIKFHPGDIKEVPESAYATAEKHGLTKVDSVKEVVDQEAKDLIDVPNDVTKEEADEADKVEAEESKIGKTKVETKKVKKRK